MCSACTRVGPTGSWTDPVARVQRCRCHLDDERWTALDAAFNSIAAADVDGRLRAEFVRLVREYGKTAVFITHSISEALETGDRIVVLKRSAMIAYEVGFDGGTGREERELIQSRIGDVLAA